MKPPAHLPLFHRLRVAFGRLFGWHWVGEDEVAVIYRADRFHKLERGPRLFRINPFTEDVRAIRNAAPDALRTTCPAVQTRDALPVDLSILLKFDFVPERVALDNVHRVMQWTPEERRGVIVLHAQNALQKVLTGFTVDQVCCGAVFDEIERCAVDALRLLVNHLGFEPTRMLVLQVTPPSELRERFARIAQRRLNAFDLAQYTPYELQAVTRAELIETLSQMSPNRQYVEFPILPADSTPDPPPVIDVLSSSPPEGRADEEQPGQTPPPRKKRPRSRLKP